jgi:hypothetical protein
LKRIGALLQSNHLPSKIFFTTKGQEKNGEGKDHKEGPWWLLENESSIACK